MQNPTSNPRHPAALPLDYLWQLAACRPLLALFATCLSPPAAVPLKNFRMYRKNNFRDHQPSLRCPSPWANTEVARSQSNPNPSNLRKTVSRNKSVGQLNSHPVNPV
jgi:hypothetical protein